MKKVLSIIGMP